MHFWIDKRSQGCGYNGRRLVPPSLSGPRRNQRLLCGGVHPKLMVTPVHRFQSIESVASGGVRHPRAPGYQHRFPVHVQTSGHYNASTSGARASTSAINNSMEILANGQSQTVTPRHVNPPTAKLKCSVWASFAILTFFIAGAKYYFHGSNMGIEALAFCSFLVLILIVGGLISLYEVLTNVPSANAANNAPNFNQIITEPNETTEEMSNQVPNTIEQIEPPIELPPPPYHIAIMLPQSNPPLDIIRDSPPPSYEKAVT